MQPESFEDRLKLARDLRDALGADFPILVDPWDNPCWCTIAQQPNTGYLVGVDGIVEAAHDWMHWPTMIESVDTYMDWVWNQ
jgi:hypothetical protein